MSVASLPNEDLARARALFEGARALHEAEERRLVTETGRLFGEVRALLARNVATMVEGVERVLALYDGLPVRINTMDLLGVGEAEVAHTQLLAWLLDPRCAHGLGGGLLAHLLARVPHPAAHALVLAPGDLDAVVLAEVPLASGIIDVVAVCSGVVLGIELKVWDQEHTVPWAGAARYQTEAYRLQLADPGVRAAVLARMGAEAVRLAGPRPVVASLLVRPEGGPPARDEATVTLSWLEVERALALLERRRDLPADARGVVRMFRSTLVCKSGAHEPLVDRVLTARALVDHRGLRTADPTTVFFQLERLHAEWGDHG